MKCIICGEVLDKFVPAIKKHYIEKHGAIDTNIYLARYLISILSKDRGKRHTCIYCDTKRNTVRSYNMHMLKNHLQEGGGITDENSLNGIFEIVENDYKDVRMHNFTYKRTIANRDVVNAEDIGSFEILVGLFERKLKQIIDLSTAGDNYTDNFLIGGTFVLRFKKFNYGTGTTEIGLPQYHSFGSYEVNKHSVTFNTQLLLNEMTLKVNVAEGRGSGWTFDKLEQVTFTVAATALRQGILRAVIGGKKRRKVEITDDEDSGAEAVKVTKRKKRTAKSAEFIVAECEADETAMDVEIVESECDEDREFIDDDTVIEEDYNPINLTKAVTKEIPLTTEQLAEKDEEDTLLEEYYNSAENVCSDGLEGDEIVEGSDVFLKENCGMAEEYLNLNTGLNLSKIEISAKSIKRLKTQMSKGIDSSIKPEGECIYYSLLGALKLLKKAHTVDVHKRRRIKAIFEKYKDKLKMTEIHLFMMTITQMNSEMAEHDVQIYVYEESKKQNVVRIFDSSQRVCKYTKNFVSFINRVLVPSVKSKDCQPLYLYLRKADKSGEIECTFITNMGAMQTVLSTENTTGVTSCTKAHYCPKCMVGFVKKERHADHILYCAGPNVEAHEFDKESHFQFDQHARVDPPPFTVYFDVETKLVQETPSQSNMFLVSYAIGVMFNEGIGLPDFFMYRATDQTYDELCSFNIPDIIKNAIHPDDETKGQQLAASIIAKRPYAINELLFNDIFSITAACRAQLYTFFVPKNSIIPHNKHTSFMKSVKSDDKCVLCDIPVDIEKGLYKNKETVYYACKNICSLVSYRRTQKGFYDTFYKSDLITKLMLLNYYYEAYDIICTQRLENSFEQYENDADLDAGYTSASVVGCMDGVAVEHVEALVDLFKLLDISTDLSLMEQYELFVEQYTDFLRCTKSSESVVEPLNRRLFIAMHLLADILEEPSFVTLNDIALLMNRYNDTFAVHHDHYSGTF